MNKGTAKDEPARVMKELNDVAFRYPGTPRKSQPPRDTPPTLDDVAFVYPDGADNDK